MNDAQKIIASIRSMQERNNATDAEIAAADALEAAQAEVARMYRDGDAYLTALAACRDAFPAPERGSDLDNWLLQAIAEPLAVPDYVKAQVAAAGASPPIEQRSVPPVFVSESLGHLTASGVPKTIDQFQLALNAAYTAGKVVGESTAQPSLEGELSDEEIDDLWYSAKTGANATQRTARRFARAVIAAINTKGTDTSQKEES